MGDELGVGEGAVDGGGLCAVCEVGAEEGNGIGMEIVSVLEFVEKLWWSMVS